MLRVRRMKRYRKARYPRGRFRARRRRSVGSGRAGGVTAALLMSLTEACDTGVGVTGPPPVMPQMVTENEARQAILQVFAENGILLEEDFPVVFRWAQDSLAFDADGFNDSLQVGFEYVDPDGEAVRFSSDARAAISDAASGDGPYVDLLGPMPMDQQGIPTLQAEIQAFIDGLKSQGII